MSNLEFPSPPVRFNALEKAFGIGCLSLVMAAGVLILLIIAGVVRWVWSLA